MEKQSFQSNIGSVVDSNSAAVERRFAVVERRFAVVGRRFAVVGRRFAVVGRRFVVVGRRFEVLERDRIAEGLPQLAVELAKWPQTLQVATRQQL